jgi:hypothetical protein
VLRKANVQTWLDAYVEAWRTYDRDAIADLFSADASYASTPTTRSRCADATRSSPAGSRSATNPGAGSGLSTVDDRGAQGGGDRGDTLPRGPGVLHLYVLRFDDDGRCAEFVEWFIEQPQG